MTVLGRGECMRRLRSSALHSERGMIPMLALVPALASALCAATVQAHPKPTVAGTEPVAAVPSAATSRAPGVDVRAHGALGDGTSDNGPAIAAAIAAGQVDGTPIVFPRAIRGYRLTGDFPADQLGEFQFNGNRFSGNGVGAPEQGAGRFNSTYTNPWNVTTDRKLEFDPAALPQGPFVTNQAISIECRPNRPNLANADRNRNWIACVYRGADTGTGGGPGTSISTEIANDVLNLNTNSGTAYEIDVNVNGDVVDGGISRGIFITGGGIAGRRFDSVALDIMHGTYDHKGLLPWGTGVSVRASTVAFQAHARMDGVGHLYQGFGKGDDLVYQVDTNGYVTAAGLALTSGYTPSASSTCTRGAIMSDDDYLYVCTSGGHFKKVRLEALR